MQGHDAYPDASTTAPGDDWSYVSEGGASIVFSYVGPSHPIFDGTVLRLRKVLHHNSDSVQHLPPTLHDSAEQDEPDDPSIAFQDAVTSKLVPAAHLPRLQTVKLSPQWLQQLSAAAEPRRPVERTAKDGIDVSRRKGVLATDLVGGKGWAVEIKPKWGFLPAATHLSPATLPLKTRYCRFCMHVHLKDRNETSTAGGYCPLDLFSRNETRVELALTRLLEAWARSLGKVNNLRVFVDGDIVRPGDSTSLNRLAAQFSSDYVGPAELQSHFIDALLPLLMKTPLLSTLSRLQRTLDSLDIEGLSKLWSTSRPGIPLGEAFTDPSLTDWVTFVDTFLSSQAPTDREESLRYHVLAYLLSATFKDCSIILRLGRQGPDGSGRVGDTITAIDLDPKSVRRLAKWEALDQEILEHFRGVQEKGDTCLDAGLES